MANPTAEWERLGEKFYRKVRLYTEIFDQDLELENYIVTGCSYGGAIGMYISLRCSDTRCFQTSIITPLLPRVGK
jgi:hypothetical protein